MARAWGSVYRYNSYDSQEHTRLPEKSRRTRHVGEARMSYKIPREGGPQPHSLVEWILDSLIRGIGLPRHDATKSFPFLVT